MLGAQSDDVMLESKHQCLDLLSPTMKPFIEKQHCIGRSRCQKMDEHREAVARAQIRGGDLLREHGQLED